MIVIVIVIEKSLYEARRQVIFVQLDVKHAASKRKPPQDAHTEEKEGMRGESSFILVLLVR